jgi:hypothetical protein
MIFFDLKGNLMKRILALIFACSLTAAAAEVAGKWNFSAKDPDDVTIKAELVLEQKGAQWSGSINGAEGSFKLREVTFDGTTLGFKLDYSDAEVTIKMKLEGNTLKGSYTTDAGPSGPVEAKRAAQGAAGVWKLKTIGPDGGSTDLRLTLKQDGSAWRGEIVSDSYDVELPLESLKLEGSAVSFRVPTEMGVYSVVAQVGADKFEGTATAPDGTKNPINGNR